MAAPRRCGCSADNECPEHRYEILVAPPVVHALKIKGGEWFIADTEQELLDAAAEVIDPTSTLTFYGSI